MKRLLLIFGIVFLMSFSSVYANIVFGNKTNRPLDISVTDGTNMARSYTITQYDKITFNVEHTGEIEIKFAGGKYNQTVLATVKHSGNDRYIVTLDKEDKTKIKVKRIRKHW